MDNIIIFVNILLWSLLKNYQLSWGLKIYPNYTPEASDFELCILAMRDADWTYANMQKALGNPSKKTISAVFKKFAPELANKDVNNNKIIKKTFITKEEGIFRYNCIKENK